MTLEDSMEVIANQARVAVMLADGLDLDKLERSFKHAIEIGPTLDPTAWIKGHQQAEQSYKLVRAFAAFVRESQQVMDALRELGPAPAGEVR